MTRVGTYSKKSKTKSRLFPIKKFKETIVEFKEEKNYGISVLLRTFILSKLSEKDEDLGLTHVLRRRRRPSGTEDKNVCVLISTHGDRHGEDKPFARRRRETV